jgi:hypothetical protein
MTSLSQRLEGLTFDEVAFLAAEEGWIRKARPKQVLPIYGWSLALAQSGRGWGASAPH